MEWLIGLLKSNPTMTAVESPEAKARVTVETAVSENPRSGNEPVEGSGGTNFSKEQFLTVDIELSNGDGTMVQQTRTHLVLVVDNSGSMAGQPWKQVKESLHAIIGSSINLTNLKTDLIVYSTKANPVPFTISNYKETIDGLQASGMTNFVSAFKKVYDSISSSKDYTRTVVVFLTDGQDTVNCTEIRSHLIPKLKEGFVKHSKEATVHAVGFSKDHDFRFLKKLAEEGGTCPGMFRYCEPGDDKQALQSKLDELFDFILESNDRKVTIELLGENGTIVGQKSRSKSSTLNAKVVTDDGENSQKNVTRLVADSWIFLEDPSDLPSMSILVETDMKIDGSATPVTIPCEIVQIERRLIETPSDKTRWRLRILERNVDDLMNQTANAVAQKTDVSRLQARVEKYQESISHTRVFGNGISRGDREVMFNLIKEVQSNLDQIQKMLAEYMRSGTDSISLLARAHDMRYQAVFNKGRRQRIMDKRASKNMQHAANAQKELAELVVNQDEIKNLSEDAQEFYFCVMSQNTVQDVLLGDDIDDAIGFGLAVRRSEVVLDEPTLIRLHVISGTLVSRNAMLDALEYKINVSSHLKAHGGFEFDESSLGVTTVGSSREPINAWLPLYVTASHWDRIKVIIKPALGSFCTLDPLGYHFKQMDVLFMVLGSMIGQLSDKNIGEHQLKLLFAVLRTCSACLVDFDKTSEVSEIVKGFVASPVGRTRDVIPNLHTLIGYIVALPSETQKEIFPHEGSMRQFWLAFISEWLRRAAGSVYKDTTLVDINGTINCLINGANAADAVERKQEKPVCNYAKELEKMCLQGDSINVEITAFDPAADLKDIEADVELKHSEEVDRAMETWAEQKSGYQKNLDQTKKYKAALRQVNEWLNDKCVISVISKHLENDSNKDDEDAKGAAGSMEASKEPPESDAQRKQEDTEATGTNYDVENITDYILKVIAKVQNRLKRSTYPNILSLPGMITFVNTWLANEHSMGDIDANSGIAPDKWIEEIKCAINESYIQLKSETKREDKSGTVQTVEVQGKLNEEILNVSETTGVEQTEKSAGTTEQLVKDSQSDADQVEDDNEGDNNDDDDFSDDYDSDDYTAVSARKSRKTKSKKSGEMICLPQIIRLIDKQADVVQTLRAMLCQAVRFHSNSSARAASADKQLLDIKDGQETVIAILVLNHKFLDEFKVNARKSAVERALWKRANYCMLWATTPWAFVGYLMNTHTSRLEGFSALIDVFMSTVSEDTELPYLKEKIHILLTGQYKTYAVLDNGNQWLPEKKMASNFKKLLGKEIWDEFEMELRSSVQIHVYRESDIPNRHGHCNSNPYIPNALRRKLGMALMPENTRAKSTRKRRR
ncbi:uncharacterized protein LOC123531588 [Mercenaria mercenaria]|uniref:uncharacterized protein LOC123531588 n=1 Tax=Mercenaria mercenaria TaxID=6596 RepID=UPI00234E943D|nr:uncharacterized protein LOC123531588 [Mercenaria mercenaria]